jgi:hypothetical protein
MKGFADFSNIWILKHLTRKGNMGNIFCYLLNIRRFGASDVQALSSTKCYKQPVVLGCTNFALIVLISNREGNLRSSLSSLVLSLSDFRSLHRQYLVTNNRNNNNSIVQPHLIIRSSSHLELKQRNLIIVANEEYHLLGCYILWLL